MSHKWLCSCKFLKSLYLIEHVFAFVCVGGGGGGVQWRKRRVSRKDNLTWKFLAGNFKPDGASESPKKLLKMQSKCQKALELGSNSDSCSPMPGILILWVWSRAFWHLLHKMWIERGNLWSQSKGSVSAGYLHPHNYEGQKAQIFWHAHINSNWVLIMCPSSNLHISINSILTALWEIQLLLPFYRWDTESLSN